uniref:EF-hand domain-containing protein n=1 Tax=Glossina brevipalpis TaxID=37001 RepID=A0A1A9WFB8_9MUSC
MALSCLCREFHTAIESIIASNGLINEAEFLQWVGRIQALRDEQQQQQQTQQEKEENASKPEDIDDVTEDLIAAFRVFDRDGNGFITRDELQTAMEMIGEPLNEQQLTQLLAIADLDQDGRINYEGTVYKTTALKGLGCLLDRHGV